MLNRRCLCQNKDSFQIFKSFEEESITCLQYVSLNIDLCENENRIENPSIEHETIPRMLSATMESGSSNDATGHDSSKQIPNDLDYFVIGEWPVKYALTSRSGKNCPIQIID